MISFSVIIPNYNHAPYLQERIESVLQQSYPHFEIIITDDASTDNSAAIIEQYRNHPRVSHILYNEKNCGLQTLQWKKGLQLALHPYIWIAESDDIAEDNFLTVAAKNLEPQEGLVLFYSDSFRLKTLTPSPGQQTYSAIKNSFFKTNHWENDYMSKGLAETDNFMKYVCTVNNVSCCVIPKNEAIKVLDTFPHMQFYSDWLFYIRLAENCEIMYSASCLNWYRSHPDSHFSKKGNELQKKKECFDILVYLNKAPYINNKRKLVQFFTEQYLGFGLWEQRELFIPLFAYFAKKPGLLVQVFTHLLFIKIFRKKIKYIF